MEEYDVVKVIRLLAPKVQLGGSGRGMRQPQIGDEGTIVHVHAPEQSYVVECVDPDGFTVWLADFVSDELELVSSMARRITKITGALSKAADDARSAFGSLSPPQLNWKPAENSWGVAQCLDHLITLHSQYFPLFERLTSGEAKPTFWEKASPLSGFFGRYLIKSMDPANLKKMKTTAKAQPTSSKIGGDIVDRFYDHQHQMIEHLKKIPATIDPVRTIITSPLLGLITYSLDDCYTMLVVHCQRHLDQAKCVTQSEAFPQQ